MSKPGRFRAVASCAFAAALLVPLALVAPAAAAANPTPYYLALGDSLSQGVQPNFAGQSVETNQGYVDDLHSVYRHEVRGLQLAKLGCPGETTTTMVKGGICSYSQFPSQLAAAVAFLKTHDVVLVTIDIGANNVDGCLSSAAINPACILDGIAAAESDLPAILSALRAAARDVRIVAMNYYDPFLAEWLQGAAGQALATDSVSLTQTFNGVLGKIYGDFGVPVANVQNTFQTTNFTPVPVIGLPLNVSVICTITWMCAPPPVGPNIHANLFGYGVIAFAFEQRIGIL